MLIATFNESTGWIGKQIVYDAGEFSLDGVGPLTAAGVMEYDRLGQLDWGYDGLRAWTASQVAATPQSGTWGDVRGWLGSPRQLVALAVLFVVFSFIWVFVSQMQ
jgi:hypothetical protein